MTGQDWTPAIGLRNAAISLLWRSVLAILIWCGGLWSFHALLAAIGVTAVPMLIIIGFGALMGTIVGPLLSNGMEEKAGFTSPLLALLVMVCAAIVIVGGEALFVLASPAGTDHLRFLIVTTTMIVAGAWILKNTLLDL